MYLDRVYSNRLEFLKTAFSILIVTGVRQVEKTTFIQ